jgi:hypothetical protein
MQDRLAMQACYNHYARLKRLRPQILRHALNRWFPPGPECRFKKKEIVAVRLNFCGKNADATRSG